MREHYLPRDERARLSEDEKRTQEIARFVREHEYSADEVREAYFRVCGIIDETKNSDRIDVLQSEMETMTKQGFPLNRLRTLVEVMETKSNGVEEFSAFVNTLQITKKEKSVMMSIVEKERSGVLSVLSSKEGATLLDIKINITPNSDKNTVAASLYLELKERFDQLQASQPIQITFTEN